MGGKIKDNLFRYSAGPFADVAGGGLGGSIAKFLSQPENVLRMETASELNHPALEAVASRLSHEFGEAVQADRVKQFIGHFTRQLMEHQGFSLANQNAKVRSGGLFGKASKGQTQRRRASPSVRGQAIAARRASPPPRARSHEIGGPR